MVLHEWALHADDDPEDLATVKMANPLAAVTVDDLRDKRLSPSTTLSHWRRFVCNLASRPEGAAIGEQEWQAVEVAGTVEPGRPCDLGLDIGWTIDATALVPLFTVPEGHLLGAPTILVPPRNGLSLRPEQVHAAIETLNDLHPIGRVVMDPSAGGQLIAAWIEDNLGLPVVAHSQKPDPMAEAAGRFLEAIRERRLWHVRDADLTRHVLNAAAKALPDGRFRFVRPVEARTSLDLTPQREIDALIASVIVYAVAASEPGHDGYPLMELI
jgi:phage terminase large subunit-like protein